MSKWGTWLQKLRDGLINSSSHNWNPPGCRVGFSSHDLVLALVACITPALRAPELCSGSSLPPCKRLIGPKTSGYRVPGICSQTASCPRSLAGPSLIRLLSCLLVRSIGVLWAAGGHEPRKKTRTACSADQPGPSVPLLEKMGEQTCVLHSSKPHHRCNPSNSGL